MADSILTHSQPFPRDNDFTNEEIQPELHFRISKKPSTHEYVIQDYLVGDSAVVAKLLLEKPHFNIGRWYAHRRNNSRLKDKTLWQESTMGQALITVATKLLADVLTCLKRRQQPSLTVHDDTPRERACRIPALRQRLETPSRDIHEPA